MRASYRNLRDAYFKLNEYFLFGDHFEYYKGSTAHAFDIDIYCDSIDLKDFTLSTLGYYMAKWRMLNNVYVDPVELGKFVARLKHYRTKSNAGRYVPDIAMSFKRRDNPSSSCLLNISLGFHSGEWHSTVVSRASELTSRWAADVVFINRLLKLVADEIGIDYLDIKLKWSFISIYQSITSTPLFLTVAGHEEWLKDEDNMETRWQKATYKRYIKTFIEGDYQKFGVQKRALKAYQRHLDPSPDDYIPLESLKICYVPYESDWEEDYDMAEADDISRFLKVDEETATKMLRNGGYR